MRVRRAEKRLRLDQPQAPMLQACGLYPDVLSVTVPSHPALLIERAGGV